MGDRRSHGEPIGLPRDGRPSGLDASDYDLSLVHSDDEYLDFLSNADLDDPYGAPDDQLSELLLSWRRDIDSEPIGDLIDDQLATVTVQAARLRRKRRPRMLVPVAAAAAVLAIAFAGIGLAARDAQPGDTLWALTRVLYSDHARSVEAAEAVKADLREAQAALTDGDVDEAKSKLEEAHAALPTVSSEDGKIQLEHQHAQLMAQIPGTPSGEASQPPQPNPTTAQGTGTDAPSTTDPTQPSPSTPPDTGTTDPTEPTSPTASSTAVTRSNSTETPAAGETAIGAQSVPGDTAGDTAGNTAGGTAGDTAGGTANGSAN